jgi:hypothetical protein
VPKMQVAHAELADYGGSSISGPLLRQLPTAGLVGVIHAAAWFTSSRGFLVGRQVWPSNIILSSV